MPLYEYYCKKCKIKFEKLAPRSEGYEEAKCVSCGKTAPRKISRVGFKLKGQGFHVNDYPSADRAIGADSERKWAKIHEEKAKRDKVRQESGQYAVSKNVDGEYVPTTSGQLSERQSLLSTTSEDADV